ncbi:MAG: type II secretion system protein [Firmicutes bacterium]|nr:type II secretion system protein [Bacillota bacterium]
MIKLFSKSLKSNRGFTLIELVVVIAVLGIIAAVAIPNIQGTKESAGKAVDKVSVKTINQAVELYKIETDDDDLSELIKNDAGDKFDHANDKPADLITALVYNDYLKDDFNLNSPGDFSFDKDTVDGSTEVFGIK